MRSPGSDDGQAPHQAWPPARVQDGGHRRTVALAAIPILALVAAVAIAFLAPAGGPAADGPPGDASVPAAAAPSGLGGASPLGSPPGPDDRTTFPSDGPMGSAPPSASAAPWVPGPPGRIAYVGPTGRLTVIDDQTGATVAIPIPGIVTGPPAWSPDGTRLAVIVTDPEATRLYVVSLPAEGVRGDPVARVVYSSDGRRPFYLYWAPDGTRVGFLANDLDGITLRTAPADGGEPVDGPQRDGVLRRGTPLYFTWLDADRILLHVGDGADDFTGEIDLDGENAGLALRGTGDFRAAAASGDATVLAYVAGGSTPEVMLASRDGATLGRMPVFGPAALAFGPTGTTLATIAAGARGDSLVDFPFGPLRLLDPGRGGPRTLIDESVIAFWWSPDGSTIAALRLAPVADPSQAARPGVVVAAIDGDTGAASPAPTTEVRLAFVDVATGDVRSDRAVRLGRDFVAAVLPYFDQYALSHRVWSPDGQAIVLPLEDAAGRTQATVLDADGADSRPIADARQAFWAP